MYYYVTLRTLLRVPVYGILCTSQGLSRYCILYLCIIALAIEGFGVKPVNIVDAVRSDLLAHFVRDIQPGTRDTVSGLCQNQGSNSPESLALSAPQKTRRGRKLET